MSKSYINADLRRLVAERADNLCEYCLLHEEDSFFAYHVDHIISEKHRGPTRADNLAYACLACNRAKGSDIGPIVWQTGEFVRFFNPRTDVWAVHLALSGVVIEALEDVGQVTINILGLNNEERLLERQMLRAVNRDPVPSAGKRITGGSASLDSDQDL